MKKTTTVYLILNLILIFFIALLGFGGFVDSQICASLLNIMAGINLFSSGLRDYRKKKNNGLFIFSSLVALFILYLGASQIYNSI